MYVYSVMYADRKFRLLAKYFALSFLQVLYVFLQMQKVSRLRTRPKGFPIALWKPSGPYAMKILQVQISEVTFSLHLYEKA